ncbi:cytochrome b/b6 domain-containing protein [Phytohabitans sp. ZYX-F-186]|uniref:Cytochrome b/b6 domain-containing protein n=1 Tax=Phytohabitans maris TaxID=3071409 RepID=A0ABU0ZQ27_9ACTN|nr:cytochrome b/b6 domain-containing protein [Phytohabitans sp. ZYX-F-186]MDQ7908330.1 cytochrome b/b6 domain-containing protein [Phytohabitans sp. ZYX-F-186]
MRRTVERYNRRARWFHAATYLVVLVLLGTGWWLLAGREGRPSPAARLTGVADTDLHRWAGWALTAVAFAAVTLGVRAARTFVRESIRYDRGDATWLRRWPAAALTGRFPRHEGHFDPGQRIANVLLVLLLLVLVGSGVGLARVDGGAAFVWLDRVHRWATYLITPVLLGHILVAAGVLPGYRGVARSMHLGGRLSVDVARRLWPGWLGARDGVPERAGHQKISEES